MERVPHGHLDDIPITSTLRSVMVRWRSLGILLISLLLLAAGSGFLSI